MCQRLSHTEQKQGQQTPMKPECWARLLLAMGLLVTVPSQPPYHTVLQTVASVFFGVLETGL